MKITPISQVSSTRTTLLCDEIVIEFYFKDVIEFIYVM